MARVDLQNVWKIYDNDFEAVKGFSATIEDGEFISLLGPSGCGKTSTLRMIAGLEKISRGDALIDGIRVNDLEPRERKIAMAFESYALYPHLTVYQNIAYPLEVRGIGATAVARQVNEICESLGIAQFKNDYPSALSGGAQQRTGLARALVRPASIYLLDEVLSHLDAAERTMLRGEIRRVQKLKSLTTLFVTHDQLEALAMSDKIIVMNDGVIQQIGTPEEIYDVPQNLFVAGFVGEPAMNLFPVNRLLEGGRDVLTVCGQKCSLEGLNLEMVPKGDDFILGIRPKNMILDRAERFEGLRGRVYTFEMLGDHTLITVRFDSGELAFKIGDPDIRFAVDEAVSIQFEPRKVLFYDPKTSGLVSTGNSPDLSRA